MLTKAWTATDREVVTMLAVRNVSSPPQEGLPEIRVCPLGAMVFYVNERLTT